MKLTLNLPPDVEEAYLAEAQAKGVPIDELVRKLLIERKPVSLDATAGELVKLDDGMWALRSNQPIALETVNETMDALRLERDVNNFGQSN